MREGELFWLRWADVNLNAGALHLVRRLKTRSSRRQVLLVSVAVDALTRHLANQHEERRQLGPVGNEQGLVVPNTVGWPLHPSNFLDPSFSPLLVRTGRTPAYPLPRPAAQRRDAAAGFDLDIHRKIVSETLGHSQIGITVDLYSPRHGYHAAGGRACLRGPVWQSGRSHRGPEHQLRARSSVGQSSGLIIRRSQVRGLPGPPKTPAQRATPLVLLAFVVAPWQSHACCGIARERHDLQARQAVAGDRLRRP